MCRPRGGRTSPVSHRTGTFWFLLSCFVVFCFVIGCVFPVLVFIVNKMNVEIT